MYPFLFPDLLGTLVPLYDLLVVLGIFFMIFYVTKTLEKKEKFTRTQINRILIILVLSILVALPISYVFDGVFHSLAEKQLAFGSITFLGGFIGGIVTFILLMRFFYKDENKDMKFMVNTVVTGIVLAHVFGRIGCFLAGCCYGIPTDSMLGVVFPHGLAHEEFPGTSIYPTQLFEAFFLFILFIALNKLSYFKDKETIVYLIGYGTWRILIEFIRGDARGVLFPIFETQYNVFPTPSQFISLCLILVGIFLIYKEKNSFFFQKD